MNFCCLILLSVCLSQVVRSTTSKKSYSGFYKLFRLLPANEDQLALLKFLESDDNEDIELDFWMPANHFHLPVDILVPPKSLNPFQRILNNWSFNFTVPVADLEEKLKGQKQQHVDRGRRFKSMAKTANISLDKFNSFKRIEAYLKQLAHKYQKIVSLISFGTTHNNNKMLVLKISHPKSNKTSNKPAIWIDGGIHAREWISPATVVYIIDTIVKNYGSNKTVQNLVNNIDWYIAPVVNPDGYEYSETDRMWRKNRRPKSTNCGRPKTGKKSGKRRRKRKLTGNQGKRLSRKRRSNCCDGVDLNRNFDWKWGAFGTSKRSCDGVYGGVEPFTEPESIAMRDFILARKFSAYLSFHSYGNLWLVPYGHRKKKHPPDINKLKVLAEKAVKAVEAYRGTKYSIGHAPDLLNYGASGGSEDWAKGKAKIEYAYTIELPPSQAVGGSGFVLDADQIIPIAKEMWEGVQVIAREIM